MTFTPLDNSGQPTGAAVSVQTWDGGGYQQQLAPGRYDVLAAVNGHVVGDQKVTLGSENVQVRFDTTQAPPAPAPAPAPVVTVPAPVVVAPRVTMSAPIPAPLSPPSAPVRLVVTTPDDPKTLAPSTGSNILSFITNWSTWPVRAAANAQV